MSHSLIYLGESAYDVQEFVNSVAKFGISLEDNRKGFVHLVALVTFPDQSSEWLHYLLSIQLQKCFPAYWMSIKSYFPSYREKTGLIEKK